MFAVAAASFSLLLVVTGVVKLVSPADTERAIAATGLPVFRGAGRVIGSTEVLMGGAALVSGLSLAWIAQALVYLSFLGWILLAMRREAPISSCGCLGTSDTPPYWGHAVLDGSAVVLSALAAAGDPSLLNGVEVIGVLATVTVIGVGALLGWVIIGDAARLHGATAK